MTVAGYLVVLLSGVLFPTQVLPAWLQRLAKLVPLTHGLEGMRLALLQGQGFGRLAGTILTLCAFAAALLAGGLIAFNAAVRATKKTGSLTEF